MVKNYIVLNNMKLWVVSELFYPEENATAFIMTKVANALSEMFDVHVICGAENYGRDEHAKSSLVLSEKVTLHRIGTPSYDKNNLLSRVKAQLSIGSRLKKSLLKGMEKGDRVLMVTNPALGLLMIPGAIRRKGNPLHILVHDVFPENTIPAGIIKSSNSLPYKLLKRLFDRNYQKADTLIALGRDMKDVLEHKLGKNPNKTQVTIIENWAETDHINPIEHSVGDVLKLQYAGNIGRAQGLRHFIDLFEKSGNTNLQLDLWGGGAEKPSLENLVNENGWSNILFHGAYGRSEQERIFSESDVSIVTLADGMYGLGVPSKTYNIMAAGRPILFIGDLNSEVGLMIKEHNIGWCFHPSDEQGILSFLKSLSQMESGVFQEKGSRARLLAETLYSEKTIMGKFLEIMN